MANAVDGFEKSPEAYPWHASLRSESVNMSSLVVCFSPFGVHLAPARYTETRACSGFAPHVPKPGALDLDQAS